jgi:hypothetical protein
VYCDKFEPAKPEPTTADKLRAALEETDARPIKARWTNGNDCDVYGEINGQFAMLNTPGNGVCSWPDDEVNAAVIFPVPPPAPKNSELVEVGRVWQHTPLVSTFTNTIMAINSSKTQFAYEDTNGGCGWLKIKDLDNGCWQLITPAPAKTLANTPVRIGMKVQFPECPVRNVESIRLNDNERATLLNDWKVVEP